MHLAKLNSDLFMLTEEKSVEQVRAGIIALEQEVLNLPQINFEVKYYIAGGMVAKELFLPKDSIVTGKIHLKEHLVHVSLGHVIVVEDTQRYSVRGPCTFVGKAGSKRAVLVLEDTVWTAFHTTTKNTIEECEAELVTNDYKLLELK